MRQVSVLPSLEIRVKVLVGPARGRLAVWSAAPAAWMTRSIGCWLSPPTRLTSCGGGPMSAPTTTKQAAASKVDLDATRDRLVRPGLLLADDEPEARLTETVKQGASPHRMLDRPETGRSGRSCPTAGGSGTSLPGPRRGFPAAAGRRTRAGPSRRPSARSSGRRRRRRGRRSGRRPESAAPRPAL